MEVIIKRSSVEVSHLAARIVAHQVKRKPDSVLGLATGATPELMYSSLAHMHRDEKLDFSRVTTFNLDEYVGLAANHPHSYHHYMETNFFSHVNIPKERIHIPDGLAKDIPASCREYEAAIHAAGGIDLQVLGLGTDGHIGFNEPSSSLSSRTRIKTLTEQTVDANRRFFSKGEKVPHHVITMGVGTIREARCCILIAYGEGKADAVARMVEGPITAMVPASVLQLHENTIVIVDEESARNLARRDYYHFVYNNKVAWQRYE